MKRRLKRGRRTRMECPCCGRWVSYAHVSCLDPTLAMRSLNRHGGHPLVTEAHKARPQRTRCPVRIVTAHRYEGFAVWHPDNCHTPAVRSGPEAEGSTSDGKSDEG